MVSMIDRNSNPVAYALLLGGLEEARDHLISLTQEMGDASHTEEMAFCVQLAHIYGHLNRAWNGRNSDEVGDAEWEKNSHFPNDIIVNFL